VQYNNILKVKNVIRCVYMICMYYTKKGFIVAFFRRMECFERKK